jgi:S-formylglutathione hydrolase
LLVDVGTADPYLHWLHVYELIEVAGKAGLKIDFRPRDHYDHSFWQVSTIIQEHIEFHSRFLNAWAE